MNVSRELIRMAQDIRIERVSRQAQESCKKLILDTVGVLIAGHDAPGVGMVRNQMLEWGGTGQAATLVYGDRLPAPHAALLNSMMTHALDFDDTHLPAVLHIMSSVFPVALAAAEIRGANGSRLMEAVIAGVEVAARIGRKFRSIGFLNSTIVGGFGATTAACKLLELDTDKAVHALGIYHAQNSGNRQALFDAALTKRIQPAFAARNAVWSAMLADKGFTGSALTMEGEAGLFRLFHDGDVPVLDDIAEPKNDYEIEHVSVKLYPTCGAHHGAILAALELAERLDLHPDAIDRIDVFLGNESAKLLVGRPFELGDNPQVNAQFSAAYAVALAFVRKHVGIRDVTEEAVRGNEAVLNLTRRVYTVDDWDGPFPEDRAAGRTMRAIRLITADGDVHSCIRFQEDVLHAERVSFADAERKFMDCVRFSHKYSEAAASAVVSGVKALEDVPDVSDFIRHHLILPAGA